MTSPRAHLRECRAYLAVRCTGRMRWVFVPPLLALALAMSSCTDAAVVPPPSPTQTPVELLQIVPTATMPPPAMAMPPTAAPTLVPSATPTPLPEDGVVVEVLQGDMLRVLIDGDEKIVRLLGVVSPPLDDALGPLALEATKGIVQGQRVRLERDVTQWDNALLRYVYRESDNLFVNAEVVRQGWGRAVVVLPDVAQRTTLEDSEAQAAGAAVGMWVAVSGPATNQPATLYLGPGVEFSVSSNLPTNSALRIDATSTDGHWFRVDGGQWIPDFFVANAPPVTSLPLASVPTPTPNWTATPVPTPSEATATPSPVPTFAIGAIKIVQVDRINEYFVLRNDTTGAIGLADWKLKSENGGEICFLSGVIGPGGVARFWSRADAPPPDYACALEWQMWADLEDETALLFDPSGQIVDRKEYPIYTAPVVPTP